jgi:hypothetical protein
MIKLLIVGRRRPGMTRAQASRHLRLVHGPMVYDPPADAGAMPAAYVQNHVFDGVHLGAAPEALAPYGLDRDLVTEIWFASMGDMIASTQTPYYLANLKPDEPRFVDDSTVVRCPVAEGAREGGAQGGRFKLFLFLKAPPGAEPAAVVWREALAPALQAANAGWVENTATSRPGARPFADRIWEAWFEEREALATFVDDRLPTLLDDLGDTVDRTSTLYLLAEEYTVERLRAGD